MAKGDGEQLAKNADTLLSVSTCAASGSESIVSVRLNGLTDLRLSLEGTIVRSTPCLAFYNWLGRDRSSTCVEKAHGALGPKASAGILTWFQLRLSR